MGVEGSGQAPIRNGDELRGLYESKLRKCLERACQSLDEKTEIMRENDCEKDGAVSMSIMSVSMPHMCTSVRGSDSLRQHWRLYELRAALSAAAFARVVPERVVTIPSEHSVRTEEGKFMLLRR